MEGVLTCSGLDVYTVYEIPYHCQSFQLPFSLAIQSPLHQNSLGTRFLSLAIIQTAIPEAPAFLYPFLSPCTKRSWMLYVDAFLVCQYVLPYQFYPGSISQIHLFFPSLAATGLDGCKWPLITFSISYAIARVAFQNVNLIIPPTHVHEWKDTDTHNVWDGPYSWSKSPHLLACPAYLALSTLTHVYFTSLPPTTACFKPSCSCVCSSFSEPHLLPITLTTIPVANSTLFTRHAWKLFLIFLLNFL